MNETCGCCQGVHAETPRPVSNRGGLSTIAYRAGDFLSFKKSMFAALAATRLTTRDDDDFTIALLDAWATTADVLTFYQERIANESYLGTAKETFSVLQLARLIGYELAPGVAANVALAFTVDAATGAPGVVQLPIGTRAQSVPGQDEDPQTFETVEPLEARAIWNELHPRITEFRLPSKGDTDAWLTGTDTNLKVGDALLFVVAGNNFDLSRVTKVEPDFDAKRTHVTWAPALNNATNATVHAMRVQTPLFGAGAADPNTLAPAVVAKAKSAPASAGADWNYTFGGKVNLEGPHKEVAHGSLLVLANPDVAAAALYTVDTVAEVIIADYALIGKATQLTLTTTPDGNFAGVHYRGTTAYGANEVLGVAERPLETTSASAVQAIELAGKVDWVAGPRTVIIADASGAEAAAVLEASDSSDGTHTRLLFSAALKKKVDLLTTKIFANVAQATHGETVRETLGSGDAASPFQSFKLAQIPLTYVYAPEEASGKKSTLQIFVNDILWNEVETLYGAGPHARVYVTRREDDGTTFVLFGDGTSSGSRLPTGHDNIRAVYRKGSGEGGNVAAHKITVLLSRPLGLSGVDNPLAAEGGTSPQQLADARTNAPHTLLTLDRVVSLLDYQSFATATPGIAKALATWTYAGTSREVFLTVAGLHGAEIADDSPPMAALLGALAKSGDPHVPLRVVSFHRAGFFVKARVAVQSDHITGKVLDAVRAAVADAFSFENRSFGQAVDASDVIAVLQGVDGVDYVDLDELHRTGDSGRTERLTPKPPRDVNGVLLGAEILVLDSYDITEAAR